MELNFEQSCFVDISDVGGIEMQEVPQTQFIPLPEVLCSTVSSLNRVGRPATISNITESLQREYPNTTIPKQILLTKTLHGLMAEGKIFFMKGHYFAPSVAMLQQYRTTFLKDDFDSFSAFRTSVPQQMSTKECQTGASVFNDVGPYNPQKKKKNQAVCANLKKLVTKESLIENQNLNCKKEKHKKKLEEKKRPPLATFNTQFPPPEWQCNVDYENKPNKGRVKSGLGNNVGSTECSKDVDAKVSCEDLLLSLIRNASNIWRPVGMTNRRTPHADADGGYGLIGRYGYGWWMRNSRFFLRYLL
uniref:Winged helix Storkhead-box1 domain-containing protein n=1 Tax=Romanomermis culicivorax TaxID=13658 RepID=A0A915KF52_ROMCU